MNHQLSSSATTDQPANAASGPLPGFILTRHRQEQNGRQSLVYWAATPRGPLRISLPDQESVCFIPADQARRAETLLQRLGGWRMAGSPLRDFRGQPVVTLYFKSQRRLYEARDRLTANGIVMLEADINPVDRFLMERFITGGFTINEPPVRQGDYLEIVNPRVKSSDYRPELRCISLDIETDYTGDRLYSIGNFGKDQQVVFMVGGSGGELPSHLKLYPDEKSLLQAFLDWLESYDPDVLIGWNIVNFDLRFLQQVADRVGVRLRLGRRREVAGWRQARDNENRFYVTVPGRVILDGIELMRTATYHFENFSLDHVAREILRRGKLVDDVDQRGEEITRQFLHDKPALARYNLEDCRLVWDIFANEQLIDFAVERARLTGLELDRYGGSVAAFDFLYLPGLHRAGYVAPSIGQNQAENASPGGYVMDSEPGIYNHVIVLDFKSLYPSIIRTFHVDPLALVAGLQEENPIVGFDGGVFSRNHCLLPELIEKLWQARDQAKAAGNRVLSQAIKIIMNSFYGVLGTSACRFFDPRLVSSITRRGHRIIKQSKEFIENDGYRVIYGDTDSVFVFLDNVSADDVTARGRELAVSLNDWWSKKLRDEQGIDSCLEIEFETHFHKFLMPTIRGAETGSKKRYAGLVLTGTGENDFQLVFKGLETVRSDWSPLARGFQRELYQRIFLDQPYEEFIKDTVRSIQDEDRTAELVLRRRLRRKLDDYVKNVPPHVQAARKAEEIRARRGLPALYQQGGWVEYLMTVNGPETRQYRSSAIDYDFYIDRQLMPIADSILVFKSTSMKKLLDRQIGLF